MNLNCAMRLIRKTISRNNKPQSPQAYFTVFPVNNFISILHFENYILYQTFIHFNTIRSSYSHDSIWNHRLKNYFDYETMGSTIILSSQL